MANQYEKSRIIAIPAERGAKPLEFKSVLEVMAKLGRTRQSVYQTIDRGSRTFIDGKRYYLDYVIEPWDIYSEREEK